VGRGDRELIRKRGDMNCPACGRGLSELAVETVVLNVCQGGCGGIWFDQHELNKTVRHGEPIAEPLRIERDAVLKVDTSVRRACPKCAPIVMQRRFYSVKGLVDIDECPKCAGIWLDAGEMEAIQRLYASEDEKRRSEKKWVEIAAPRTDRRTAPESVLPYLSRKIHYNPIGVIGYRSADSETAGVETWRDRIESPPDTRSKWAIWGGGVALAAFLAVGGLHVCLTQHVALRRWGGFYHHTPLQITGAAAVGQGLMAIAIGLFLHFHLLWGTTPSLQRYSTPGKIASVLLLILGAFLFVWKAWVP
jgi:Zn-finger nucleic acid-binding protein